MVILSSYQFEKKVGAERTFMFGAADNPAAPAAVVCLM